MNRQHAQVYEQISILKSTVFQPDFFDQELAHIIVDLVTVFTGKLCKVQSLLIHH